MESSQETSRINKNDIILSTDVIIPCVDPRFFAIRRHLTGEFIIRRTKITDIGSAKTNNFFANSNIPLELLDKITNISRAPRTSNIPNFNLIPALKALIPVDDVEEDYVSEQKVLLPLPSKSLCVRKQKASEPASSPPRSKLASSPSHHISKQKGSKLASSPPRHISKQKGSKLTSSPPHYINKHTTSESSASPPDDIPEEKESKTKSIMLDYIRKQNTQELEYSLPRYVSKQKASELAHSRPHHVQRNIKITEVVEEEPTETEQMISRTVKQIFGHNRYDPTPSLAECDNMESSYAFMQKEEARSARIAKKEDLIEKLKEKAERSKKCRR